MGLELRLVTHQHRHQGPPQPTCYNSSQQGRMEGWPQKTSLCTPCGIPVGFSFRRCNNLEYDWKCPEKGNKTLCPRQIACLGLGAAVHQRLQTPELTFGDPFLLLKGIPFPNEPPLLLQWQRAPACLVLSPSSFGRPSPGVQPVVPSSPGKCSQCSCWLVRLSHHHSLLKAQSKATPSQRATPGLPQLQHSLFCGCGGFLRDAPSMPWGTYPSPWQPEPKKAMLARALCVEPAAPRCWEQQPESWPGWAGWVTLPHWHWPSWRGLGQP